MGCALALFADRSSAESYANVSSCADVNFAVSLLDPNLSHRLCMWPTKRFVYCNISLIIHQDYYLIHLEYHIHYSFRSFVCAFAKLYKVY